MHRLWQSNKSTWLTTTYVSSYLIFILLYSLVFFFTCSHSMDISPSSMSTHTILNELMVQIFQKLQHLFFCFQCIAVMLWFDLPRESQDYSCLCCQRNCSFVMFDSSVPLHSFCRLSFNMREVILYCCEIYY